MNARIVASEGIGLMVIFFQKIQNMRKQKISEMLMIVFEI